MARFLLLLYIFEANGIIVPEGVWIASWIILALIGVMNALKGLLDKT